MNSAPTGRIFAVLLAAGASQRMLQGDSGITLESSSEKFSSFSKCLVPINGRSALTRIFELFSAKIPSDRLVVVASLQLLAEMVSFVAEAFPANTPNVIEGGRVRQESVALALKALSRAGAKRGDWVVIHDVARALLSKRVFEGVIDACFKAQAATVAVPAVDSLKVVSEDGTVLSSLDRSQVWCVQTPQLFEFELIFNAHKVAAAEGLLVTDDCALVERKVSVKVVPGDKSNFKLTSPEDLLLAEAYCRLTDT